MKFKFLELHAQLKIRSFGKNFILIPGFMVNLFVFLSMFRPVPVLDALNSMHWILCIVFYIFNSMNCILLIILYILNSIHFIL